MKYLRNAVLQKNGLKEKEKPAYLFEAMDLFYFLLEMVYFGGFHQVFDLNSHHLPQRKQSLITAYSRRDVITFENSYSEASANHLY